MMNMEPNPLNNKDIAWLIMTALVHLEILIWLMSNILIDVVFIHDIIGRCLVFVVSGILSIIYSRYFRDKVLPFLS